jgi:hypothetical protein
MHGNANLSNANLSIAQRDKQLMNLQSQIEDKEAQIKQDYSRLKRDVKHNSFLQFALDEYNDYFAQEKAEKLKKIKALTGLLQYMKNNDDIIDIKREIKYIKRK